MKKYIVAGLLAALMTSGMVASAAFASPASHFEQIDTDHDGHVTAGELDSRGCKLKPSIVKYMDENNNGTIERREFIFNHSLVRKCK